MLITLLFTLSHATTFYNFTTEEEKDSLILKNFEGRYSPRFVNDHLELLRGIVASNQSNAVIFPDIINDKAEIEHYFFSLYITPGAEGAGIALVNVESAKNANITLTIGDTEETNEIAKFVHSLSWESPNLSGSFGLGIDVHNPQTSHIFDKWGNFYGREEREISLHWDGKEIFKMMSPVEFRADPMDGGTKNFDLTIQYVTAGALITLAIEDTIIIDKYFIPEMTQYVKQPVFGATTGELTTTVILDSFAFLTEGYAPEFSHIESFILIEDEVFHSQQQTIEIDVFFPEITEQADKVIMTLYLTGPEGGVSDWDVGASIYLIDRTDDLRSSHRTDDLRSSHSTDGVSPSIWRSEIADTIKTEILRYITPYRRPYTWKVDVSHFIPVFTGEKQLRAHISTWEPVTDDPSEQKGWKITAKLDFYKGYVDKKSFKVVNLWSGNFEYGDPENPMKDMLDDFYVPIPEEAISATLRIVTTGHGMNPNYENAAEFRPSDRWIHINDDTYHNLLWKTDNYLNPCRPQDGTWKFDRAGWAPGDIVHAWEIDLDKYINDKVLQISYEPDDYVNYNRGDTWEPFHILEAQVIFYQSP